MTESEEKNKNILTSETNNNKTKRLCVRSVLNWRKKQLRSDDN